MARAQPVCFLRVGAALWLACAAGCTAVPLRHTTVASSAASRVKPPAARSSLEPSEVAAAGVAKRSPPVDRAIQRPASVLNREKRIIPVSDSDGAEPTNPATDASQIALAEGEETHPAPRPDAPVPPAAYTLSLSEVLDLADAQNPNVALARERINEAYARVDRSAALWLPSLRAGMNYNHHEGAIQNVAGDVFQTNRSAFYGGLGANAVGANSPGVPGLVAQFHLTDAIFQPRISSQQAASRQFGATAARNDVLRDAATAYLELLRAEGGVAIAQEALDNTEKLAELIRQFAETGQGLQADYQRMLAEMALRRDQLVSSVETQKVSSARLAQVLHADPSITIAGGEALVIPLEVLSLESSVQEYVATGLSRRPELAEQKHLVCEAVERLRREKYAPLVPSVLLGFSYGGMGGGLGNSIINTNSRWDADAIAYWEIRNLGVGERAARGETGSVVRQAQWRELAALDRVAREVAETHAQVTERRQRIDIAQAGIEAAARSYSLNLQRIENVQGLPIEVLQAVQALATARRAYLNAVVDYNIAQFELCRAIGWFVES